jgi:hypothetical protein
MTNLQEHNLDYLAARQAQELIWAAQNDNAKPKDVENTVTKALGVLQENGVYACFLYLYASEGKTGEKIAAESLALFEALEFPTPPANPSSKDVLGYVAEEVTKDNLSRLLLAKETLEQMLIYARYGAKAWDKQ